MRGTIRKNNCLRAFFDNVRDGRVGPMAPAPFATMIESHKVRPAALRALGTERAYSLTDDEFEDNKRTWDLRNLIVDHIPGDESALTSIYAPSRVISSSRWASRRPGRTGLSFKVSNMSFCLPVPSAIRLPWRVGHEFGPTGVDSDGVCATSVPILRTSPSRVTWCVAGAAWRGTAPRRARPRIGRGTSRNATGISWLN